MQPAFDVPGGSAQSLDPPYALPHPDDNPSIGIILYKSKNKVVAEYSLRDIEKSLAITTYVTQLVESLPEELKGELDPPRKKRRRKQA